ncbi:MAG: hypothetical protein AAF388_24085 [Bacteroidota bacterium]
MIHCYQYNTYEFETLDKPFWILGGYAEYVSRASFGQESLKEKIQLLNPETDSLDHWKWIEYEDGTGVPAVYLRDGILIHYLMEVENLPFDQIWQSNPNQGEVERAMWEWYVEEQANSLEPSQ